MMLNSTTSPHYLNRLLQPKSREWRQFSVKQSAVVKANMPLSAIVDGCDLNKCKTNTAVWADFIFILIACSKPVSTPLVKAPVNVINPPTTSLAEYAPFVTVKPVTDTRFDFWKPQATD